MPYTQEQAHAEIANLVANFRANEPNLADAPEAQIEDSYIRKLFHYLNWNTDNTGMSVAEWEFVLQRTDEKGKRPDYILQLDGQQVLVMDAKKVKYDMHDPRWMQQVYAYAYSTQNQPTPRKIDFAVLTDFQEFVLLDCTLYAAEPKAVSNFRILDWTCDDYVHQFDTLWELFERENVRAAARTHNTGLWSRYLSPKKVKANRIPPDKSFLAKMDDEKTGWRVRLAKDMKKRNPEADGALITAAVQLLIDRLIFVKALSDYEIEADYLAQLAEHVEQAGLAADDAGWFNACQDIFAKLNQFYNGSIFEPRPELEAVTVSNQVVREVIRDLQPENSPYNFAVLPVEILGTIYERFLGRVVRATEKQVKIEDKPEVRKAGGVYYTPQYIVNYIVQNTVGELLAQCKTPADAAKLRILDPACGSGSFLLGAYAALIRWHEAYYSDKEQLTQRDREAAYYDSDGRVRLTAKLKRQILLNNLFGVDIDAQAVEVTRFSLSLKALEDTRRDELYQEVNLFKQTVLPDLRHNIKHGNSLIGPDYFAGQMFADKEELLRVRPFDWAHEFPAVMTAGGFDAVIGNPPYIQLSMADYYDAGVNAYFSHSYSSSMGRMNTFGLFIERALRSLLAQNGILSFIVPNTLLTQEYYQALRQQILNYRLENITLYQYPVFADAVVETIVFVIRNAHPDLNKTQISECDNRAMSYHTHKIEQATYLKTHRNAFLVKVDRETIELRTKLDNTNELRLKDVANINQAIALKYDRSESLFKKRKGKNYKPVLDGRNIQRYILEWGGYYLAYDVNKIHSCKRTDIFEAKEKVFFRRVGDRLIATYDDAQFYALNTLVVITLASQIDFSLKYVLGLLNSRLMNFYYVTYLKSTKKVFSEIQARQLSQLPIRRINFSNPADKTRHDQMVQLVESMLALHKHKVAARTQAEQEQIQRQIDVTDRQIDTLVYELYGLTPDEIAVVQGAG
jgi:type I restriction-modification system DNA methylase subunit